MKLFKLIIIAALLTPITAPAVFVEIPRSLFLAALDMVPTALAAGETFSWTLPTKRTNDAALAPVDIAKSTVKCGTASGGPYATTKDATGSATSLDAGFALTDGNHYCVVTVTAKTPCVNDQCESGPSPELYFFVKAGAVIPNPSAPVAPGGFKLNIGG